MEILAGSLPQTGLLPAGDVPAVCQPETVLPQQMARLPQQLPLQPEGTRTYKAAVRFQRSHRCAARHVELFPARCPPPARLTTVQTDFPPGMFFCSRAEILRWLVWRWSLCIVCCGST